MPRPLTHRSISVGAICSSFESVCITLRSHTDIIPRSSTRYQSYTRASLGYFCHFSSCQSAATATYGRLRQKSQSLRFIHQTSVDLCLQPEALPVTASGFDKFTNKTHPKPWIYLQRRIPLQSGKFNTANSHFPVAFPTPTSPPHPIKHNGQYQSSQNSFGGCVVTPRQIGANKRIRKKPSSPSFEFRSFVAPV